MDAKIAQKRQTGSSARMTVLCGVTACVVCGIFLLFNYFLVNQRISMLEERLDRLQRRGKPNINISLQRNVRERRSLQDDTRLEMADLDLENRLNNAEKER